MHFSPCFLHPLSVSELCSYFVFFAFPFLHSDERAGVVCVRACMHVCASVTHCSLAWACCCTREILPPPAHRPDSAAFTDLRATLCYPWRVKPGKGFPTPFAFLPFVAFPWDHALSGIVELKVTSNVKGATLATCEQLKRAWSVLICAIGVKYTLDF